MKYFLSFVKKHNLELPKDFLAQILKFCDLLLEANKSTNLVSKNDEKKLLTRHVADSLIFAIYLNSSSSIVNYQLSIEKWADIGSGAGFPVIPLCLYLPQIKFFAIECRKKRCEFLNLVKQKLDLQNLEIVQGKAGALPLALPPVDIVSCRAVSGLREDFECAKKLLKEGGHFLTVKSKRIVDELRAKNDKLLKQAKVWNYLLPQEEMEYALVEFKAPLQSYC